MRLICLIACLQSNRARRCEVQGSLLWSLSQWLASDPQWLGSITLPHGSWVSFISPNLWGPEAWRRDGESSLEQALPLLKLMSSNQQIDLLSVDQELWSSDGWGVNGKIPFALVVQAWDSGRGHRSWLRGESFQGWGDCWSGMHGEFMPNLWPMHTTSGTVLPEEGDLDLLRQGLWWHSHARWLLHNHGLQARVCNSYPLCNSDPLLQYDKIKSLKLYKNLGVILLDPELWWG